MVSAATRGFTTAISRVVKQETAVALQQKLDQNVWATPSRSSPNAAKLEDGAIQRASVCTQGDALSYVKANPDGIGFFKRPELNTKASGSGVRWADPLARMEPNRDRVCRIYMPQRKHVHCHPTNKTDGNYWAIEFATIGNHKSPLMGWKTGSQDVMGDVKITFGTLSAAIAYAEMNGWGFDVMYPNKAQRWHVKKNYADNFKFKGHPKPVAEYD